MYATSKLIIPPKPARNSPYIPKLRIKLKPLNRNRLVHGASLRNGTLVQLHRDVSLRSVPRGLVGSVRNSKASENSSSQPVARGELCEEHDKVVPLDCDTSTSVARRTGSKRKQAALEMDQLDLEGPESILTKISLKALINRETFYAFPAETQRMLADLLPFYDRQKQSWPTSYSSTNGYTSDDAQSQSKLAMTISQEDDESVWLHPSALSNEFFTKALQDYADRQARGEFAPRLRNRAGLRANAASRSRYSSALLNSDLISEKHTIKQAVSDAGSRYDLVRRTRARNKTYTTNLTRQTNSYRSSQAHAQADSGTESSPSPSTGKSVISSPMRDHNSNVLPSQNLSCSANKLVHTSRMKLREKSTRPQPFSRTSSDESPRSAQPISNDDNDDNLLVSSQMIVVASSSSPSVNDSCPISSTSATDGGIPPSKSTKSSPTEFPNSLARSSLSSPKGLDLCDGLDAYSLTTVHKHDESMQPLKSVRQTNYSPSTPLPSSISESKCLNTIGSSRSGRGARGLGSAPISSVPLSMPPPRQTKTLAAMREKLRAKRMLKEAERHPSGPGCYPLPGSMTPHPASGSCGYFHQPTGYAPSGSGFGSPTLTSISGKRSSSALGSPQNSLAVSPTNCDKQLCHSINSNTPTSVSLCTLLNGTSESSQSKVIPNSSPSSPHSLPNAELSSPLLNSSLSNDFLSHISLQDSCTFGQEFGGQSYPSSPLSTNSSGGLFPGSIAPGSAYSPQSAKTTVSLAHNEIRQEQSVSAPPTPVLPQAGQTMLTFSPLMPALSLSSTPSNICVSRVAHQTTLATTVTIPSAAPSLPASHSQTMGVVRPVFSSAASASSMQPSTTVLSGNPPTVAPQSTRAINVSSSSTNPDLRTSHSYPALATLSPCVSSTIASTNSSISVDTTRSPQVTTGTAPSLNSQLSASAAVTKFLVGSSQNRPATTTRAFFVDGDNLSEAVALLQSLNPKATITQQQFLLIPSSNKSQMFLCPTPSTSTPNILSVPISTSASPANSTNGTSPVAAVAAVTPKSTNPNATPVANLTGIRQLAVGALNAIPNQTTPIGQLISNATTAPTNLDPTHSLHPKTTNVVLSSVAANTTLSTTQTARSLICSKSVMSYPQTSTPNVVQLKPQPKYMDNPSDRVANKPPAVAPRRTLTPVTKSLTETVYATPVTQSQQIAFSLLAPGASGLTTDTTTPVMFVSETNPTAYAPRQLNLSAIQSPVSLLDRNPTMINSAGVGLGSASATYVATPSQAAPGPVAVSAHMTVINPAQLAANRDMQLQQQQHRIHSVPAQLRCSSVGSEQTVQAIRATSISYATTVGTASTTYLSAATIVSPCLPAVVLPHTLTVQSPRTNVITSCVNGTDRTMFRSVP